MALRMLVGTLLLAGCYQPSIVNGGYTCAPSDDPPCPSGFYCVDGVCVDAPNYSYRDGGDDDMPGGDGDDMGSDPGNGDPADMAAQAGVHDLAQAMHDLAQAPVDMAHAPPPPPDLAIGPDMATGMCEHAGGPCTTPNVCCSNYCRSDGICIGG